MINLVEELKRLVRIKSEVKIQDSKVIRLNYEEAANAVAELAERAGLSVEEKKLITKDGYEIPTIIASIKGKGPTIAFVSHYDVIPAKGPWMVEGRELDPYKPIIIDGKLYGRGAADDKSAIVASIAAFGELLSENQELSFKPTIVVTGDEEIGGYGIRALLEAGYRWDKVVILDAGAEYVSIGASGVIHGWIEVEGKAGHAGYPHFSVNPVENLVFFLNKWIEEYKPIRTSKISNLASPPNSPVPKLWGRISVTIIGLGKDDEPKHNRIPSKAIAGFDVRLIPEEDLETALDEIYSSFVKIQSLTGIKTNLKIVGYQRGWYAKDQELINRALLASKRAYEKVGYDPSKIYVAGELGGNDGTFFDMKNIPVIAFGAIRDDCNIHAPGEFVYIKDVEMLKEFVKGLLTIR